MDYKSLSFIRLPHIYIYIYHKNKEESMTFIIKKIYIVLIIENKNNYYNNTLKTILFQFFLIIHLIIKININSQGISINRYFMFYLKKKIQVAFNQ